MVILIIGILAAIAMPAFLSQRSKGQDSSAKSQVRNLVSHMEACFTEDNKYVGCTAMLTPSSTNLDIGNGIGQVRIVAESGTGYTLQAISRARSGGVSHTYTLVHTHRRRGQQDLHRGRQGRMPGRRHLVAGSGSSGHDPIFVL